MCWQNVSKATSMPSVPWILFFLTEYTWSFVIGLQVIKLVLFVNTVYVFGQRSLRFLFMDNSLPQTNSEN